MTLDPKIIFYLKNQKQIDEWYNLRVPVATAAHEFFCSLQHDLQLLAGNLSGESVLFSNFDGGYPKFVLHRKSWCDDKLEYPFVGICLEWTRKDASFAESYSGVWTPTEFKGYDVIRPIILGSSKVIAFKKKYGGKTYPWWPVLRYEKPLKEYYWEDLDGLNKQILASLEDQWNLFRDVIDGAVDQLKK